MKKAAHNARLKNLTDRILQICASNGVSLAYTKESEGEDYFKFVTHDKVWDKELRDAIDGTKEKSKQEELTEAARQGFGSDDSEGRTE